MQLKTAISNKAKKYTRGQAHDQSSAPELAKHGQTSPDLNDTESAWLKSINNVASAACKDKTADEIFRQIGGELGRMGVSSVFFTREPGEDCLMASHVTLSSGGIPIYPAMSRSREKASISAINSEIISSVLSSGEMVLITEPGSLAFLFPTLPGDAVADNGALSYVCAPLGSATGVLGVLVAAAPGMTQSKARNIALLAHIASMSHSNSRLVTESGNLREKIECLDKGFGSALSELDKSLQDVVQALTIPMEMRDPYTSGHQKRVTRLAVAIAEEMGVAQDHIDGLKLAASIHDIGKIVIPFEILNRPMRLSISELTLIKMHPQVAFEMLSPISFRWPVAEIVRQHHERADGSGYPRGLKSGQTLLEAKILAVADVVEAMSSQRPYRASLGIDVALDEVSGKSGSVYDAEAVAACIRLLLIKNFSLENDLPSEPQNINPFTDVKD